MTLPPFQILILFSTAPLKITGKNSCPPHKILITPPHHLNYERSPSIAKAY